MKEKCSFCAVSLPKFDTMCICCILWLVWKSHRPLLSFTIFCALRGFDWGKLGGNMMPLVQLW